MKVVAIQKGDLRGQRELRRDIECLRRALPGADLSVLASEHPGHAVELARTNAPACDYLLAIGGDGTLHEVLNGLMSARAESPSRKVPVLGVLPRGTANDFSRTMAVPSSVDELAVLIGEGAARRIDVGRIRCMDKSGETRERCFINAADVGIGASVVQHLGQPSRPGRALRYPRAIARGFLSYRPREVEIRMQGQPLWQGRSLALVVANGRYFGSGLCIAPGADPASGALSVTLVGDVGVMEFLRHLGDLRAARALEHPQVRYLETGEMWVNSPLAPLPVEADGEFLGFTPASFSVEAGALSFLAEPAK